MPSQRCVVQRPPGLRRAIGSEPKPPIEDPANDHEFLRASKDRCIRRMAGLHRASAEAPPKSLAPRFAHCLGAARLAQAKPSLLTRWLACKVQRNVLRLNMSAMLEHTRVPGSTNRAGYSGSPACSLIAAGVPSLSTQINGFVSQLINTPLPTIPNISQPLGPISFASPISGPQVFVPPPIAEQVKAFVQPFDLRFGFREMLLEQLAELVKARSFRHLGSALVNCFSAWRRYPLGSRRRPYRRPFLRHCGCGTARRWLVRARPLSGN